MNEIKAKYNRNKGQVATRLFKMENKSKMYLGILKHWISRKFYGNFYLFYQNQINFNSSNF